MHEHRGANSDEDELGERLFPIRLPGLVPDLVPSRELARMAMSALRVVDRDIARHDGADHLEVLPHLAQRGRLEAELGLHVVELRRTRGLQVSQETRSVVTRAVRFDKRGAGEW